MDGGGNVSGKPQNLPEILPLSREVGESDQSTERFRGREVDRAQVTPRFTRHPLVLRLQLQRQLGTGLIKRLCLRPDSIRRLLPSEDASPLTDEEALGAAKKLAEEMERLGFGLLPDDQLIPELEQFIHSDQLPEATAVAFKKLLQRLVAEGPGVRLTESATEELTRLIDQFGPRAMSIFLQTGFGKHVLDLLQSNQLPDTEKQNKMLLGLTLIKSQLDVRPAEASDASLVEYVSLYMGEEINLQNSEHTLPVVWQTVQSILYNRSAAIAADEHLSSLLTTPSILERLPMSRARLEVLQDGSDIRELYRLLKADTELRNYLNDGLLSRADCHGALMRVQKRLVVSKEDTDRLGRLVQEVVATGDSEAPPSHLSVARLSKILKACRQHCGNDLERQTLTLLRNHLDYQVLEETRQAFMAEMYRQLASLERGGSEKTFTLSLDIGGALSVAGAEIFSAGGKLEYQFSVTGNDDVRVREFHIGKPSIHVKGGDDKVVSAAGSFGSNHAKGRVFRSLGEFVQFHSNDFVPMLMGTLRNLPGNVAGSINTRRAQALHDQITADRQLLSQRLTELGVLLSGDRVNVHQTKPVNFADFHYHGVNTSLEIQALAGLLTGKVVQRNTITHFKTHTNLLQMLRNNPDQAIPPHSRYLSFWSEASKVERAYFDSLQATLVGDLPATTARQLTKFKAEGKTLSVRRSDQEARQWLAEKGDELEQLRRVEQDPFVEINAQELARHSRLAIREQIKKAMVDQYLERDMYYFTVNAMEGHLGEQSPQKYFHQAKKSLQSLYGAGDRGQFIAAHIYSFHHLHRLYESTFLPGETPVEADAIFHQVLQRYIEPSLDNPQLNLQAEKHVRRSLTATSIAKSTEKMLAGELSVNIPGANVSLKADFKHAVIGKHVNPDNDGNYFTVGVNIQAGGSPALVISGLESALKEMRGARFKDSNFPDITLAEFAPDVLGTSIEAGVRLEFHLVKRHKGWRLQYTRISGSDGMGVTAPAIGIPTGPIGSIKLGASAKVSGVRNWWEQPGNNTLTYLYAKFNGWKAAQMIKKASFDHDPVDEQALTKMAQDNPFIQYTLQNREAISQLLVNMANPEKSVHREYIEMVGQLNLDSSPWFSEHFSAMLREHAESPTPENFMALLPEFERFLTFQHEVYLEEARSRYRPNFRKGRII